MIKNIYYILLFLLLYTFNILHYQNLYSNIADFGFLLSNIYKLKNNWEIIFSEGHIQPLLYLFNVLNLLKNGEFIIYIILFLKIYLLILGYILIENKFGYKIGILYILYTPIWIQLSIDFHIELIIIPIQLYLLIYYEKSQKNVFNKILFTISVLFICFSKEIYAIQTFFILIYFILKDNKNKLFYIYILYIVIIYIIISLLIIFPHYLKINDILRINQFNTFLINNNIIYEKLKTFFIYFIPLFFVYKYNKYLFIWLIPFIAIFIFTNSQNYSSYFSHYYISFIPVIFSCIHNINKTEYKFILVYFIITLFLLSPSPLSRLFFSNKIENYNYNSYIPNQRNYHIKKLINKYFSSNSQSIISIQNSINTGILSYREWPLPFPLGINNKFTPLSQNSLNDKYFFAEYVLVDLNKSKYIIDNGCNYVYKTCTNKKIENEFYKEFGLLFNNYKIVIEYDGFYILKRL